MFSLNDLFFLVDKGVSVVLSIYLVYWITQRLDSKINRIIDILDEIRKNGVKRP